MSRGLNSRPNAGEDERITIDTTDLEGAMPDSEETNKYADAPEATSPILEREAEGRKKPEEKKPE